MVHTSSAQFHVHLYQNRQPVIVHVVLVIFPTERNLNIDCAHEKIKIKIERNDFLKINLLLKCDEIIINRW